MTQVDESRITFHDMARTAPGTLGGRYLRTFWQPVFVARELAPGKIKPIRIMSEDFTLYRTEGGTPYVVDSRCAHRGVRLSLGRVEAEDIRCPYHGWKYAGSGQCVAQPAEPSPFCDKIRIKAYPTREYLGLIFAYFGEGEPPELPRSPDFEDMSYPRVVASATWPCNYFSQIENTLDYAHTPFLHPQFHYTIPNGYEAEETPFGLKTVAHGLNSLARAYNTGYYFMPNCHEILTAPWTGDKAGNFFRTYRVPVDDASFTRFDIVLLPVRGKEGEELFSRQRARFKSAAERPPIGETAREFVDGGQDFNELSDRVPFLELTFVQDAAVLISMEPLATREHNDHLGRMDAGVILARKLWTQELRALAAGRPLRNWQQPESLWKFDELVAATEAART